MKIENCTMTAQWPSSLFSMQIVHYAVPSEKKYANMHFSSSSKNFALLHFALIVLHCKQVSYHAYYPTGYLLSVLFKLQAVCTVCAQY